MAELTRTEKYLDNQGLNTLWSKIKTKFQEQEAGKGLSTNDYTTEEKNKLAGIAAGAEVNVQANWTETEATSDAFIKNKPTSLPNPKSLTIGGKSYTGSSAVSVSLSDLNVYSKTEIDTKLTANVKYSVVSSLPATGTDGTIYLVPSTSTESGDVYNEYMWVPADGATAAHFELIGSTKTDLSEYAKTADVESALSGKMDKPNEAVGSTTKPIYINASGEPTGGSTYAGGTKVTLNGSDKGASTASFYAPTASGTSGQYLKSNGSGAPKWETMDTAPTEGSTKAVTSGAIKTAMNGKLDKTAWLTDDEIDQICV